MIPRKRLDHVDNDIQLKAAIELPALMNEIYYRQCQFMHLEVSFREASIV